jgi:hypothetical protein
MAGYFGLTLEQLASRDYTHTQQVSAQVHAMLGNDGQAQRLGKLALLHQAVDVGALEARLGFDFIEPQDAALVRRQDRGLATWRSLLNARWRLLA